MLYSVGYYQLLNNYTSYAADKNNTADFVLKMFVIL